MARKQKTNPVEDVLDLVSLLPWWAGIAIAVVGYVLLHRLAAPVPVTGVQLGQINQFMAQTFIAALATFG